MHEFLQGPDLFSPAPALSPEHSASGWGCSFQLGAPWSSELGAQLGSRCIAEGPGVAEGSGVCRQEAGRAPSLGLITASFPAGSLLVLLALWALGGLAGVPCAARCCGAENWLSKGPHFPSRSYTGPSCLQSTLGRGPGYSGTVRLCRAPCSVSPFVLQN